MFVYGLRSSLVVLQLFQIVVGCFEWFQIGVRSCKWFQLVVGGFKGYKIGCLWLKMVSNGC